MEIRAAAVLFDMDGTLVDSMAVVDRLWSEFATAHDIDLPTLLAYAPGRQTRDTVARFLPAGHDPGPATEDIDLREVVETEGITEIAGARQLLASLNGSRYAVVTSASLELADARLVAAGLGVPEVLVCSDDVTRGKPDPEGYLEAARRLGVAPEECLVFEDAEAGIQAGLASGGGVVVVGTHESRTTATLPRVADLTAVTARPAPDGSVHVSW